MYYIIIITLFLLLKEIHVRPCSEIFQTVHITNEFDIYVAVFGGVFKLECQNIILKF
jgi:hypothetical protein